MLLLFELFCFPSESKWHGWPEGLGDMATGTHHPHHGILLIYIIFILKPLYSFLSFWFCCLRCFICHQTNEQELAYKFLSNHKSQSFLGYDPKLVLSLAREKVIFAK